MAIGIITTTIGFLLAMNIVRYGASFGPTIRSNKSIARNIHSSTQFFMNKNNRGKKTKGAASRKSSSGSNGFGSTLLTDSRAFSSSFPYSGSIRPGKQSPQRVVVDKSIVFPDYALDGVPKKGRPSPLLPWNIEVKTPEEIEKMRASGKLAREILDMAGKMVAPGITTDEIDTAVYEAIVAAGAYPSTLNFHGYTKSCCTSVNEVICHGIPDDRKLEEGDIINVDVTVYLDGYHGDCSEMFVAGETDEAAKKLLQITYDCWIKACQYVQPGRDYKDLGGIIEDSVVPEGFSTVRDFCGHGIGR